MNPFQKQLVMPDGRTLLEQMNDGVSLIAPFKPEEPAPPPQRVSIAEFEAHAQDVPK